MNDIEAMEAVEQAVTEWMPMGQRVLRGGYRRITRTELAIELGVPESVAKKRSITIDLNYDQAPIAGSRWYLLWTCLEAYLEPIPAAALSLIETAHNIGFEEMYVFTAEKAKSLPDPVVAARWNDKWWFITRWV